jgi:hypothetical protein
MALGFPREAEQEKIFPSTANSMSIGHSVSAGDDAFITSSMYESTSKLFVFTPTKGGCSQEETASTESGDEDFSSIHSVSVSLTSKDSEASDDDKSLSPRSSDNKSLSPRSSDVDVAASTCIYSIVFLMNVKAACCGRAQGRNILGYGTELAPKREAASPVLTPASKSTSKSSKYGKQRSKATAREAKKDAKTIERLPMPALPASTADSWVMQQRTKITSKDDDAKVLRAMRSILNKLTLEKFESLFDQLVDCGIQTPSHVSMLMQEVFEKATTQHQFIPMYAELCKRLEKDSLIGFAIGGEGNQYNFRRLLLDECQRAFEQLLQPCSLDSAGDEEEQIRRKQKALGNIKLVGELLVQGMLGSALFVKCCNSLLQSRETCAEALECLAALVMVAGPKFDVHEWQHHASLEQVFSDMADLTRDKSTPPRKKFLLRDVLDMRKANWCTSVNQAAVKAQPMTLEEVREKAAEENPLMKGSASPKRQQLQTRAPLPVGLVCRGEDNRVVARPQRSKPNKTLRKQSSDSTGSAFSTSDVVRSLSSLFRGSPQHQKYTCETEAITEVQAPLQFGLDGNSGKAESLSLAGPSTPDTPKEYDVVTFRRALASTLTKLALDKNVPAAVQYIRLQEVPVEFQADEFCDILSRILEEKRGAVRRCELAFAAGLVANEQSPFDSNACLQGIGLFFRDVYADLCTEVPRLPAIIRSEFVPTMNPVYQTELNNVLPEDMRV